ncbi:MAG: hypothetical protein K2O10_07100, partial [Muribaculaceae bacterium]|nr:hypothetical protein [Muribaculaceae bacterium]
MKKLLFILSLVMSATFGMKAVDDVQLIAYGGGIYESSYGAVHDNYRYIPLTNSQTADGWYVVFDTPVEVNAGDEFCFAIWPENMWPKSGLTYPADNNTGFAGDNNGNMKFGQACSLNAVRFYWTGDDTAYWAVEVYTDDNVYTPGTLPSPVSDFAIDVWAMPQSSDDQTEPWDIAGGLYAPFNEYGHYTDLHTFVEGVYPLADRFRGQHKVNPDKKFLKFCGPLTDDEMQAYGDHARHWASADYREGTKFDREDETELYVIDFCEGNDLRGLYVQVPTVDDMNLDSYDPTATTNLGAPAFYRMGVRFGFIDQSYAEEEGNGYNDHLRFVKWGHCFRLNEISRPVNAFPQLDATGTTVVGFTDDFGPCQWNGLDASGPDFTDDTTADVNGLRN